jgi:hypothetical protein
MSGSELMAVGTFAILFLGAIFGTFWRFWGLIDKAAQEGKDAKTDLASYKLHAAETFATKQGVTEQMVALTKAVNDVGDRLDKRLDGMTDRLDRVIEASHKPVRRQS